MKRPVHFLLSLLAVIITLVYLTFTYQFLGKRFDLEALGSNCSIIQQISSDLIKHKAEAEARSSLVVQNTVALSEVMKGPLAQDDPRVADYIRNNDFLVPPSTLPYYLTHPGVDPSVGQSQVVLQILKSMKNGFFVECGALDGETRSNTLELEMNYGWKGLLIEGDPRNIKLVLKKNRKSWVAKSCLANKPFPHEVTFRQQFNMGRITSLGKQGIENRRGFVRVQCFPLFSLLTALNVTVVDYFSLDVEGHEFRVLQTIPFTRILIKVLSVEYIHDKVDVHEIERFMSKWGYRVVTTVINMENLANDIILVHESVEFEGNIEPVYTSLGENPTSSLKTEFVLD